MRHKRFTTTLLTLFTLLLAAALLGACDTGNPTEVITESVPLGGAEQAEVVLGMGGGRLNVSGGAEQLMDAEFSFNVDEWAPSVGYEVVGDTGQLAVTQPEAIGLTIPSDIENAWDVQLNDDIPMDLSIGFGAGEALLELSGLDLTELDIQTGAGQVTVDLTGDWNNDLDAEIRGGVGQLVVRLPSETGVRVRATQGLGNLESLGLSRDGDFLVNDAYGQTDATLDITIESGIGETRVEVVE